MPNEEKVYWPRPFNPEKGDNLESSTIFYNAKTTDFRKCDSVISLDSKKSYVYLITLDSSEVPLVRLRGRRSRILYVGQGGSSRVRAAIEGGHHAWSRVRIAYGGINRSITFNVIWVQYGPDESPLWESVVLNRILWHHGELPPCNARSEGWYVGNILLRLVRHSLGQDISKYRLYCYDWHLDNPLGTWVDVYEGPRSKNVWKFSVVWAWTNTWRGVNAQKNGYPGVLPGSIVLVDGMPNKKPADSAFGDGHDLQGCMIRCQADWSAIDGANDNLLEKFVRSYVKALGSPTSKHDPAEVIEEIIGRISDIP